ncbi:hypothetical protein AK812_SmicGene31436 [Symbiodinium microadriaticum]|uniref:Uncharacterized protein n=1 Tax=Symbiodinium microadriaticum TaxID=2951 RepID=A0A1Q9CWP7_SYMMI|nr:hypothetical protein AK812_SmicGene31436 [Symbiodinium microadriaticum]
MERYAAQVFCSGGDADACFVTIDGSLKYTQDDPWWTHFRVGDLISLTFSKLAKLDAEAVCGCISSAVELQNEASRYARRYLGALNMEVELTDLWALPASAKFSSLLRVRTL